MNENNSLNTRPYLVAAYRRSVESYRPERERLFDDRFSRGLIPPSWKISLKPVLRQAIVAMIEATIPGYVGGLYCRTRYIDEVLNHALVDGIKQVVILGQVLMPEPIAFPASKKRMSSSWIFLSHSA